MEYIVFNGKFYVSETAIVSAGSRGLRFGDGLFETMKFINGEVEFIDEHFARLWKGMQVLQFKIPKHFTPDFLQDEIIALLKKNNHLKNARIRLSVFRGNGGLYDEMNHIPNYVIETWPLADDIGKWNSNGLVLGIYKDAKKSCDVLANLKHNNFLPYALAALHAKKQKWNDALLLNAEGGICDATIANIFLIKDEIIYTPSLNQGCIAGIMRKNIIDVLKASNYVIVEGKLGVEDMLAADEVFLSNSIYNIRWVQMVGDKKYSNLFTQKIYGSIFSTK